MVEEKYDYQFEQDAERARIGRAAVKGVREVGLYAAGGLVTVIIAGVIMISSALRVNPSYRVGER